MSNQFIAGRDVGLMKSIELTLIYDADLKLTSPRPIGHPSPW
jgi:hypothetical protein